MRKDLKTLWMPLLRPLLVGFTGTYWYPDVSTFWRGAKPKQAAQIPKCSFCALGWHTCQLRCKHFGTLHLSKATPWVSWGEIMTWNALWKSYAICIFIGSLLFMLCPSNFWTPSTALYCWRWCPFKGACCIGAQSCQQLEAYIPINGHSPQPSVRLLNSPGEPPRSPGKSEENYL